MSQLITINLSKGPGTAWGFRLQGGKDFAQPLCIQKVNVGSVAEAAGLRAGDAIVSIGSSDALALRHKEAQDAIVKAGSSFQMVVQRGAMTWKPQVTALAQPKKTPEGPVATQTSLAATGKQQAKYNSPINLYNEDSIMEALSAQSEVLGKGCLGINFRKFDREVKLRTDSPTYLMIHGEDAGGAPKPRKTLPPQDAASHQSKPVFPTPQPGQQGYYNINDKLYCDVHAKQAAKNHPPGPNLVPVTVQPGAPIPAGAVPAPVVKTNAPLAAAPPATPAAPAEAASVTPPATHPEDEYDAEPLLSPLEEGTAMLHEAVTAHEAAPPPACPQPELNGPIDEAGLIETEPPALQEEQQSEIPAQDHVTAENEQQLPEAEAVREEAAAEAPEAQGEVSKALDEQPSEAEPSEHETQALEPEQEPQPPSTCQPEPEPEVEVEYCKLQQAEPEPELVPEPQPEILQAPVLEPVVEEPPSPARVTASEPAPSFDPAPAPIPIHPPAPAPAHGGSSANPAAFGSPSGGIDVRAHIPKKGPAPAPVIDSAPAYTAPKVTPAPAAPAPIFTPAKPVAAPAPAPMFNVGGGGGMPRPAPPPGMGGMSKPPGIPTKGIPGERTAPKRGRGVMTPAHASRIPICANCQRQIRGPFVTALGKNWCPDHFHCTTESCRKPLIEIGFVEEQGSLYCENCYELYLAPTCGKCDKRIKGDCLNAVGKQFHPECFCCAYCGKVFGSGAFYLEDGLPYCETDWNDLFTTKCVGCGFPIEAGDRWVEALNNNYHSQCFKCSKCHKNLEGQSFFAKGGKPFCKAHAQRGF